MEISSQRSDTAVVDGCPRLSILEGTPIQADLSAYAAIQQTIEVAMAADESGYYRLWVTEHHGSRTTASSAPAVLIAAVAAHTTNVRVGSGGVMLSNHPPLVVAEQFSTLEALYPGRIDLGIGGASGAAGSVTVYEEALGRTPRSVSDYPRHIDDLVGFVSGTFPAGHRYADIAVSPRVGAVPIFVLGSGEKGATLAAERGLPFAFAHHLGLAAPEPVLRRYRASFVPSAARAEPYAMLSVAVVCASTDTGADDIVFDLALTEVRRRQALDHGAAPSGQRRPDQPVTSRERDLVRMLLATSSMVTGSPSTVADRLIELADRTGVDELMVVPLEQDGQGRIRTVRMLAEGYRRAARPLQAAPAPR
ncbi:MsnO8 family LLM class oxidoreductase [Streptomyces sp. NBC_01622]|uniref:MsnO8 family LLM class oxidoreductase n=1 Tax=Streptomyces sp. NBC_01622 TaxID=2975903 RepID=UPI0038651A78|nr:MsnO8 family LLM class oxidoreductase [Streptomyces sp. NBC_01622]